MIPVNPDKFLAKIRRLADNECWPWLGRVDRDGYGLTGAGKATVKAHRVAAALSGIDIKGKIVRHTCDNPSCCNPAHLLAGTQKENVQDMWQRKRQGGPTARHATASHCVNGHEFTDQNTRIYRNSRVCIACEKNRGDKRTAAKQANRIQIPEEQKTGFALRVSNAIKASGKSYAEIWDEGGPSPGYLSQIVKGETENPSVKVMKSLADALGVRAAVLVGWEDQANVR